MENVDYAKYCIGIVMSVCRREEQNNKNVGDEYDKQH